MQENFPSVQDVGTCKRVLDRRFARSLVTLTCGVLMLLPAAAGASGWQEMHETSDDVRVEVNTNAIATVQHHLRYRIVAGQFKSFELVGIDPRAEVFPEAVLTAEKGGAEVAARVEPVSKAPGTIRITIDEGKGLGRGVYVVDVRYRLDLVATKMLTRDGAMWKLAWTAPPASEGHDGARVIFDLPAAPTEPRLAATADSTTTLATVRRTAGRDELELLRAHVPRGEAATWAARIDPKAFPGVTSPELRPPPVPQITSSSLIGSNVQSVLVALGFALFAGALATLLREKQRAVRAAAALRSARARPVLPLPFGLGPFAYGIAVALSLAMLLWWSPLIGAMLVVLAMALSTHRAPETITHPRRSGAWRPMSDSKALLSGPPPPLPTDAFDIATTRARLSFGVVACSVAASAWLLHPIVPRISIALPLVSAALVPIFVTGTRSQLAPTPTELAARWLRPVRDALAATMDLSHVDLGTIGRVVTSAGAVDEVRLVCAPRDRTPGLRAIELALANGPVGHGAVPEVFIRFDDGSSAAERVARLVTGAPVVAGRTPEERVVRIVPDEPNAAAAAALVSRLALALEGRRARDRAGSPAPCRWKGIERRGRLATCT